MNLSDISVVAVASVLIGWELWFFLNHGPPLTRRDPTQSSAQEVRITIEGWFRPNLILVEAGLPVRLHFYRGEAADRSANVSFDNLNIEKSLPEFETTLIEFIPAEPGDYLFRCGDACEGLIVAQTGREGARANLGRGHQKHG